LESFGNTSWELSEKLKTFGDLNGAGITLGGKMGEADQVSKNYPEQDKQHEQVTQSLLEPAKVIQAACPGIVSERNQRNTNEKDRNDAIEARLAEAEKKEKPARKNRDTRPVVESRDVLKLGELGSERMQYKTRKVQLDNAMEQGRPGAKALLKMPASKAMSEGIPKDGDGSDKDTWEEWFD
jgi:hypothetical protein